MTATLSFTSADLEAFPDDGKRYEIIDGELYVSEQPHFFHQRVCINVVSDNTPGRPQSGRTLGLPDTMIHRATCTMRPAPAVKAVRLWARLAICPPCRNWASLSGA